MTACDQAGLVYKPGSTRLAGLEILNRREKFYWVKGLKYTSRLRKHVMNLNSVKYKDLTFLHMSYFSGLASQLPYHRSAVFQVGTKNQ